MRRLLTYLVLMMLVVTAFSQTEGRKPTRILFILDASNSMNNNLGSITRIQAAKNVLYDVAKRIEKEPDVQMALRVFGHQSHQSEENCRDSKLEVGFRLNNTQKILEAVDEVRPKGITPIALSIKRSERDFSVSTGTRNVIVLITDGFESCEENACEVSLALQRKGIIIQPYIIGLNPDAQRKAELECIGEYEDIRNATEFEEVMTRVVDKIIYSTTTKVHLLDEAERPTETDANMTFYSRSSGVSKYNMYHTINNFGKPDSIYIEPIETYNMVVHTNPPITKDNVVVKSDEINIIEVPAAQGFIQVDLEGGGQGHTKIPCIIRRSGEPGTLDVQGMGVKRKWLLGNYDVEILTLPRILVEDVLVVQSETTLIRIPVPGVINFRRPKPIYGAIFREVDGKTEEVVKLNSGLLNETIKLQPGKYWVVYRVKTNKKLTDSKTTEFSVSPGETVNLNLK